RNCCKNMSAKPHDKNERHDLLGALLKSVSRSFYLTLRVLPRGLREPIGLAYLLARAADTIADTSILPPEKRLDLLLDFRAQIDAPSQLGTGHSAPGTQRSPLSTQHSALSTQHSALSTLLPAERKLLESLPQAFELLNA